MTIHILFTNQSKYTPLQNPGILIPYLDNLTCSMGMAMLDSTYAQYLGQVHASSAVVRSTFILMGTFNIVSKLVTGNFMDKRESAPITFSLVGNAFMLLPFMSLGKIHIRCSPEGVPILNAERELC